MIEEELGQLMLTKRENPETYVPHFKKDNVIGSMGEALIFNMRNLLRSGKILETYQSVERIDNHAMMFIPKQLGLDIRTENIPVSTLNRYRKHFEEMTKVIQERFQSRMPNGYNAHYDFPRLDDSVEEESLPRRIACGSVEIKADVAAPRYGNLFLEFECSGLSSGVRKTKADIWAHIIGYGYGIIFVRTDTLRSVVDYALENDMQRIMDRGANPTKGAVIPYKDFFDVVRKVV